MKVVRWKSVDRDYRMSFLLNLSSHFGSLMCDAYFHCFAAGSDNENKPLQPLSYTSWQQGEPDQACCVCYNSSKCCKVYFQSLFLRIESNTVLTGGALCISGIM